MKTKAVQLARLTLPYARLELGDAWGRYALAFPDDPPEWNDEGADEPDDRPWILRVVGDSLEATRLSLPAGQLVTAATFVEDGALLLATCSEQDGAPHLARHHPSRDGAWHLEPQPEPLSFAGELGARLTAAPGLGCVAWLAAETGEDGHMALARIDDSLRADVVHTLPDPYRGGSQIAELWADPTGVGPVADAGQHGRWAWWFRDAGEQLHLEATRTLSEWPFAWLSGGQPLEAKGREPHSGRAHLWPPWARQLPLGFEPAEVLVGARASWIQPLEGTSLVNVSHAEGETSEVELDGRELGADEEVGLVAWGDRLLTCTEADRGSECVLWTAP